MGLKYIIINYRKDKMKKHNMMIHHYVQVVLGTGSQILFPKILLFRQLL